MNTSDLLENCIQMERIVGQIYAIFMKQQSSCPEYACLWEKTAREEYNHEQQFVLAKRLAYSMKTDAAHGPHPSNELVKKLAWFKTRVAEIPLAPSESIRLAIDLEESLSAFHMDQKNLFTDESINSLFTAMMKNDDDHIGTLKNAFTRLL